MAIRSLVKARARHNPTKDAPDVERAAAVWKLFHKKRAPREMIRVNLAWPKDWEYAGEAVTTYYRSDKWEKDGKFIKYYHDHEGGKISIYHPAGKLGWTSNSKKPASFTPPASVAVLGYSLGVDVKRHDTGKVTHVGFPRGSYLVASPDRRHLWVVEKDQGIIAMITGPGLRVNPEGICG